MASLDYGLIPDMQGLHVVLSGFNDKVGTLCAEVFRYIMEVKFDDQLFLIMRDRLKKMLENIYKEQP